MSLILETDVEECMSIVNAELGEEYLTRKDLSRLILDVRFICVKHNDAAGRVDGIAIGCLSSKEEAILYLKMQDHREIFNSSKKVGIIKSVIVRSSCQKRGVGKELILELETVLKKCKVDTLLGVLWNASGAALMKDMHYESRLTINDYWYYDAKNKLSFCPPHGPDGCHETGDIYIKTGAQDLSTDEFKIDALTQLRLTHFCEKYNIPFHKAEEKFGMVTRAYFVEHLNKDCFGSFVCNGDKPIACAILNVYTQAPSEKIPNGKFGKIYGVYVKEEYKDTPLAQQLVKSIIKKAEKIQVSKLEVEGYDDRPQMYKECGFKEAENSAMELFIDTSDMPS